MRSLAALLLGFASCSEPQAAAQQVDLLSGRALLDAVEIELSGSRDSAPYRLLRQPDGSFHVVTPIRDAVAANVLAKIADTMQRHKMTVTDPAPTDAVTSLDPPLAFLAARFGEYERRVELGKLARAGEPAGRLWARADGRVGHVAAEVLACLQFEQERLRARALFPTFTFTKIVLGGGKVSGEITRANDKTTWTWSTASRSERPDAGALASALQQLTVVSYRYGADLQRGEPSLRITLHGAGAGDELRLWQMPEGCLAKQPHRDLEVFVDLPAPLRACLR
jgi:hypothetical protein